MNLEIRFTLPEQAPRIIPLSESRLLIGALLSNEVVVRAPGVDPIHAMIEDNDDGEKVVIDLGSHNGVVLNGQRVEVEAAIKAGDVITLGNVRIEVLQAGTAAAAEQQQEDAPVPAPPVMGSSAVQTAGGTGHGTGAPESVQASAAESMHTGQPVSGHATGGAQPVSGHATAGAQPVSQPDAPVSSHPAPEHDDDAIAATVRTNQATNKRGEQLFSPRKARPQGNVLEVVSYWGDTILDVELFDRRTKGYEVCTIGDGTDSHLPAGGSQEVPGHVLAKPGSDGFKVYLMEDMKARIRKGGKVFEKNGKSRLSLARRDVVHISHGAVRYFLMFVKPPPLDLPPNRARDPLFVALLTVAMLFYFSVVPIIWMTKPVPENQLEDDAWALVNLPEKKKEPEKPKKKPKTKQKLVEKKKPPPPKPPKPKPRKPVPVKPTTKAVVKKKPKKTVPVKAKVKAKTPAKQLANTKNKVRPRKPSKTPSNRQKQKQAGKPSLNKLKKAAGMASTGAKKPNFKLAGARAKNKSLKTGGAKGSGMNQRGGARKGKRAHSYMGVEGVKNNKASGVNLSKLGLGAGKILNKTGPSAIHTKFRNSAGGAGGGSGSYRQIHRFWGRIRFSIQNLWIWRYGQRQIPRSGRSRVGGQ